MPGAPCPTPLQRQVTPELVRLLQHWRHHAFSDLHPFFFRQVEAIETLIWLTEVAPNFGPRGKRFLDHLDQANAQWNPGKLPAGAQAR